MSAEATEPTGPDLERGVSLDQVVDGRPLLGHYAGDAVLLARIDGEVHAVGATCTHYGGPLAEGLVVGDTVRCPWHHACFSLRTGRMLRPPALAGLPRYRVVVEGDVARVTGPLGPEATTPGTLAGAPESILIIGGGAAGFAAALTLREEGYAGPVCMISSDTMAPYDRPNCSKDYLAGNAPEEWMPLRADAWYQEQGIELMLERSVQAIRPSEHRVVLDDGASRDYGALLVATGAEPIRLRGAPEGRVRYLRTLADSRAIIAAAERARRAVVVGASFIGLEAAASLRSRGLEVTVVAPEHEPMERTLGAQLGSAIRRLHEGRGVAFRLGRSVTAVDDAGVALDDGGREDAELIVAGIGVRPRVALLEDAGADVANGVIVDAHLRTSLPDVYAAGDIASWPAGVGRHIRVEHWVVAERQGRTAARNMLGADESFDAVPFFWSAHYDELTVNYVGHADRWDAVRLEGDPDARDCAATYLQEGRVAAVATIFRDAVNLRAELELEGA
jgi:apoptosis-inducing factor 3